MIFGFGLDLGRLQRERQEAEERRRLSDYQWEMAPHWRCRIGTVSWRPHSLAGLGVPRRYLRELGSWMV